MAPPAGTLRVGRYFLALVALLVVLYGVAFFPGHSHTPKLGLDLVGGAQVVLQASTTNGTAPSRDAMNEARTIISDRVNGRGVSNSEVAIEGNDRITVTIPGKRADDITNIGTTALLEFRPLLAGPFRTAAPVAPTTSPSGRASGSAVPSASGAPASGAPASGAPASGAASSPAQLSPAPATGSSGASAQDATATPLAAGTASPAAPGSTPPAAIATPSAPAATAGAPAGAAGSAPAAAPTAPPAPEATVSGAAAVTAGQIAAFRAQAAAVPGATALTEAQVRDLIAFQCATSRPDTAPGHAIVSCTTDGSAKYLLAPRLFPGTEVGNAQAIAPGTQQGSFEWTVSLTLKSTGQRIWSDYTAQHNSSDSSGADTVPADYVAFTLDGKVVSAPHINGAITTPQTSISGGFTQASATSLANSLKYGALPLSFAPLTSQTVSATLGTSQLAAGLLAGGIGLALVVVYSLAYYRGLGLVTLASLVVSGGIIYALLVLLGRQIGFTLTLAGIAGFIVAVGITADSFVVFFERVKDEVHDGRSMRVAVPRAWARARRTVLSADVVSLLAAVVLYVLAAGDVRGFAFTLGLSTVVDVVVVFWFTHPLVSLLSRSAAFGSPRFTGLNSLRGPGQASAAPEPAAAGDRPRPATRPAAGPAPARTPVGTVVIDRTAPAAATGTATATDTDADADADPDDAAAVDRPTPAGAPATGRGGRRAPGARAARRAGATAAAGGNADTGAGPAAGAGDAAGATTAPGGDAGADATGVADTGPDGDDTSAATASRGRPGSRRPGGGASATGGSAAERAAARRARLRADQEGR